MYVQLGHICIACTKYTPDQTPQSNPLPQPRRLRIRDPDRLTDPTRRALPTLLARLIPSPPRVRPSQPSRPSPPSSLPPGTLDRRRRRRATAVGPQLVKRVTALVSGPVVRPGTHAAAAAVAAMRGRMAGYADAVEKGLEEGSEGRD